VPDFSRFFAQRRRRTDVFNAEPFSNEVALMDTVQANVTGWKATIDPRAVPKARRLPEACRILGVSRSTMYRLAAQGQIRLVRIGGRTLVPESELDRLVAGGA
jgi:excisionase family DNA binding protein